jgi:peptidoglycan hydrolase-like protein with peptidoglycan-binding domain
MAPRTLQMPMRGQDVTLLHALLNYHMPPPDDQLPVAGPGALDFGPRTLAKVKKFQEINKIDFGTKYFMDGVVGPNTWAALTKTQQVTVTVTPAAPSGLERAIERHFQPSARLTPPALILPQSNPPLASKGLVLDSIQVQAGGQGTLPFSLHWHERTRSFQLQIVAVILNRGNKQNFHNEIQFGAQYLENRGPGATSKRDLSLLAVVNQANLPGLGGRWSWGIQEQFALTKSLVNSTGSLQGSIMPTVNLSVIKRNGNDVLQLTGQAGLILELDPPGGGSGNNWGLKAGFGAFLGLTGTYTLQ